MGYNCKRLQYVDYDSEYRILISRSFVCAVRGVKIVGSIGVD